MCIVMWLVGSTAGCVNKCSQVSNFLIGTRKNCFTLSFVANLRTFKCKISPQIVLSTARSRLSQVRTFALGGKAFRAQGSSSLYVWLVGW